MIETDELLDDVKCAGFFSNTSVLASHTLKVFKTRWTACRDQELRDGRCRLCASGADQ